jgi:hypothetical protein
VEQSVTPTFVERLDGPFSSLGRTGFTYENRRRIQRLTTTIRIIQELTGMPSTKLPQTPVVHQCPVCHFPQTKIQRKLSDDKHGATNYVCARAGDCVLGINLANVDTWVAVRTW